MPSSLKANVSCSGYMPRLLPMPSSLKSNSSLKTPFLNYLFLMDACFKMDISLKFLQEILALLPPGNCNNHFFKHSNSSACAVLQIVFFKQN